MRVRSAHSPARNGRPLRLEMGEVHVWELPLDVPRTVLDRLERLISAEEAARAARFAFARDRDRYRAAHGLLRLALAGYLGTSPKEIEFERSAGGKPRLVHSRRVRFNLSHAGALGLAAVSADREVGIDVEEIREVADLEGLAATCFSPAERAALAAVPAAQRLRAFFSGWTRKEAFLKTLGDGLSRPLDSFDVTLAPGEPARLLRLKGAPGAPRRYALRTLEPAPAYVGALAVDGRRLTTSWRRWGALAPLVEESCGSGRVGGHRPVRGGRQPRGTALDLAGG